jgi:predicted transcriptional regulator
MKVTIDLDAELYRAVKVEAARADRSVREIVDEALAGWLERLEDAEDAVGAAEALAEYERDGGAAADEFFRAHAAETRAAYGSDGDEATAGVEAGPGGASPPTAGA